MANKEQLAILKQGVSVWNAWRAKHPRIIPELPYADLRDANLERVDLSFSNLEGAKLSRAILQLANLHGVNLEGSNLANSNLGRTKLRRANLVGVDLSNANLISANATEANFGGANLRGADFSEAALILARFTSANLSGAKFDHARISFAVFDDCDLSELKGTESVHFNGPSSIGVDSIYKSKGKIPHSFLSGCGVPENFIRYIPSLVNSEEGIQFYSCFISYSSKDEELARRLHGRMRDAHLRVWFAPEDVQSGQKLHEQIETAIRIYDKLLIVLSEASLQSEWVMTELRKAFKAQKQSGKRKLFPVRLVDFETLRNWECFDADSGKDLAVELREYFIPDFSNWKEHDQFEAAFKRLLKDLRAEERTA